ncbi:NUC153 domain protein [Ostertagia ostertagi]
MPDVSHTVNVSRDGRYVFATGSYKSWLKCYDLENLSLKFQRGLDAAVIKMIPLSDDYSKIVLLQEDRFLEMHAAFGRYFRMRMPRFGRDMAFSIERSDLFLVGASSEVYRLNLELGEWLSPLQTNGSALNCCQFCSTANISGKPEISSLKFRDALRLAVDRYRGRESENLVLSMDGRVLKIWNEIEGKPFAAIETEHALNDFCRYPDSGLIFMANEAPRMQQFFIPSIGTAPKWCSYLEALTEELEETQSATVYDDYKFVTKEELDQLSLSHLIGSSVLRAYMHGTSWIGRLYEKAQLITQPFAYEKYKNRKVQDIMHQERENRVIISKTEVSQPKVNKELAARLRAEAEAAAESIGNKSAKKKKIEKKKASTAAVILQDDRFKKLFADEDFEVDQNCELFKRNVAIQRKESSGKVKEIMHDDQDDKDEEIIEQSELPDIDDLNETTSKRIRSAASSSSDDDSETDEETLPQKKRREREKARRKLERRERQKQLYEEKTLEREAERTARLINKPKKFVLHELDSAEGARRFLDEHVKETAVEEESSSLASKKSRLQQQGEFDEHEDVFGERSITFSLKKRGASAREAKAMEERKKHKKERREETVPAPLR